MRTRQTMNPPNTTCSKKRSGAGPSRRGAKSFGRYHPHPGLPPLVKGLNMAGSKNRSPSGAAGSKSTSPLGGGRLEKSSPLGGGRWGRANLWSKLVSRNFSPAFPLEGEGDFYAPVLLNAPPLPCALHVHLIHSRLKMNPPFRTEKHRPQRGENRACDFLPPVAPGHHHREDDHRADGEEHQRDP